MKEDTEVRIETFGSEPSRIFLVEAPDAGPEDVGQLQLERSDGVIARLFPTGIGSAHEVLIFGASEEFAADLLGDWSLEGLLYLEDRRMLMGEVRDADLYVFLNGFMKS